MENNSESHVPAEELCRTCAQSKKDMISIYSEEGRDRQLPEKVNSCLPITVKENDRLPLQMCLRCILWLETSKELRDSCITADFMLKVLLQINVQEEEIAPSPPAATICDESMDCEESITVEAYTEPEDTFVMQSMPELEQQPVPEEPQAAVLIADVPDKSENARSICTEELATQKHLPPPFKCDVCDLKMHDAAQVIFHQWKQHHKMGQMCSECYVMFSSVEAARDHEKEVHPYGAPPSLWYKPRDVLLNEPRYIKSKNKKIPVIRSKKKKTRSAKTKHVCPRCKKIFSLEDIASYKEHLAEHKIAKKAEKIKNANIKCDYCEIMFVTNRSKIFHMEQKHKQYKPFICEQCAKPYHNKKSLLDHLTTHTDERPFLCDFCGKSFPNKNFLKCHFTNIHSEKFPCTVCSKKLVPSRMKAHMRKHYNERIHQCEECGKSFFTGTHLRQHLESHSENVYECEICGNAFSRKNNLYLHKKRHFDVKTQSYVCPATLCGKRFSMVEQIVEHCKSHSRNEFRNARSSHKPHNIKAMHCWSCNRPYRRLTLYLSHMKSHHSDEHGKIVSQLILTCNICKSIFHDSASLTEHLKGHPEAFDIQCHHCKEKFVSDKQRAEHEATAHGHKKKCEICCKVISGARFTGHMRVHSGVRPFKCSQCDKAFFEKKYLDTHMSIHTGVKNFICEICSRAFRLKQDLKKHYFIHTKEKMYQCGDCDFSSNRRQHVIAHIAAKHTDILDSDSD